MRILRKHWLLILLIVIGLLWWPVFRSLMPHSSKWLTPLIDVDYWSIVTTSELFKYAWVGFTIVSIFAFIKMWHVYAILIVPTVLLCAFLTCFSITSFFFFDRGTIYHVMSVQFHDRVYQLAFGTYSAEYVDMGASAYYIFVCDSSGNVCSKIREVARFRDETDDHLVVSDDKLMLDRGFEQIQILPAVNGAS